MRNELDELQEEVEHLQEELKNERQEGDVSFIHHMELEAVRANKEVMAWQEILSRNEKSLAKDGEDLEFSVPDFMQSIPIKLTRIATCSVSRRECLTLSLSCV